MQLKYLVAFLYSFSGMPNSWARDGRSDTHLSKGATKLCFSYYYFDPIMMKKEEHTHIHIQLFKKACTFLPSLCFVQFKGLTVLSQSVPMTGKNKKKPCSTWVTSTGVSWITLHELSNNSNIEILVCTNFFHFRSWSDLFRLLCLYVRPLKQIAGWALLFQTRPSEN